MTTPATARATGGQFLHFPLHDPFIQHAAEGVWIAIEMVRNISERHAPMCFEIVTEFRQNHDDALRLAVDYRP